MLPVATLPSPGFGLVQHLDVLEQGLELADARLHLSLEVLGGVVVAVLAQVPQGPGGLDLLCDLDPSPGRQVLELSHQAVVGAPGEVRCHGLVVD